MAVFDLDNETDAKAACEKLNSLPTTKATSKEHRVLVQTSRKDLVRSLAKDEKWTPNEIVCEHRSVVLFELDAYPEPKVLQADDLTPLFRQLGTVAAVAKVTGLGWSAVQEKLRPRPWNPRRKKFEPIRS